MCKQKINDDEKSRQITDNFNHHVDVAVPCGVHRPMEHILGCALLWVKRQPLSSSTQINVCDGYSTTKHQDYTQTCREVAYGICKGAIKDKIKQQCPDKLPVSTTELNFLIVWSKWTA